MDFDDFNIQDDFVSVPLSINDRPVEKPTNYQSPIQPASIFNPPPVPQMKPIPTPDQIPSLSPMPPESNSLKSRTVQTLISQNQDLTARLTVSLKRNIELEQKVETQEEHYQRISTQYDLMKDQLSLAQEKAKRADYENEKLMNENGVHEQRFAELYTAYQDKIGHIQTLSYRLHRYLQYRERIKKVVRPFIMNLKNQILAARQDFISLNDKSLKQTETISELRQRLSEAVDHIQSITKKFEKDQSELVQYHEDRYQQISAELTALKGYSENQEQQNSENKKAIEAYKEAEVALQNKSIFFERKYTDLKNEFEQISREFIEQKTHDNQRLTTLEIQLKEISSQFAITLDAKNKLEIENRALNDQYQSLQILFQDGINKTDELKKMNQAQDQINKELSQTMVEQRKKNEFLEQKLMETEEDFKRKLQSLQLRFQKTEPSNPSVTQIHPAGQKELLSKIQNLLTEIQTGHSQTANLDFEDNSPKKATQNPEQLMSEFGDIEN